MEDSLTIFPIHLPSKKSTLPQSVTPQTRAKSTAKAPNEKLSGTDTLKKNE